MLSQLIKNESSITDRYKEAAAITTSQNQTSLQLFCSEHILYMLL